MFLGQGLMHMLREPLRKEGMKDPSVFVSDPIPKHAEVESFLNKSSKIGNQSLSPIYFRCSSQEQCPVRVLQSPPWAAVSWPSGSGGWPSLFPIAQPCLSMECLGDLPPVPPTLLPVPFPFMPLWLPSWKSPGLGYFPGPDLHPTAKTTFRLREGT